MLTMLLFCIPSVLFVKIGSGEKENGKKWKLRHFKLTGILRCYLENYYNSYILDYLVQKNVVGGYQNYQLFLFLSAFLESYLFFLYFYLVCSSCTGSIDTI